VPLPIATSSADSSTSTSGLRDSASPSATLRALRDAAQHCAID
jgi:hypothetical protein